MQVKNSLYINIIEELRTTPVIDESSITVVVEEKGLVVLGGKVKNYSESCLIESIVKGIKLVRWIINELEIESDRDILKAVLEALKRTVLVPHERIKALVKEGHLTLSGEVKYFYQRKYSQKVVEHLYGVNSISNNIMIKSNVIPFETEEKILEGRELNTQGDSTRVGVLLAANLHTVTDGLEIKL